jgi:hypothetical protein
MESSWHTDLSPHVQAACVAIAKGSLLAPPFGLMV